nr:toprim domain-containing protein [uncultured Ruegeria sp.]
MTTTNSIYQQFGGDMIRPNELMTWCPVCQQDSRADQRALSVRDAPSGQLLVNCFKSNCSFREIVQAWNLPRPSEPPKPDPDAAACAKANEAKRREYALRIWKDTIPVEGTPTELYLHSRGITTPMHPHIIRHCNRTSHPTRTRLPAMIARIQAPDGKGQGIWRTFLTPDGQKASREPVKAGLGSYPGGAVRLGGGEPEHIAIGEGIETTAAFTQIFGLPAWACLSTAGIENFVPPPFVRSVGLLVDIDDSGAGLRACEKAAFKLRRMGMNVRMRSPDSGFADWNDQLLGIRS